MTFDVLEQSQAGRRRIALRRHLQVEYGDIGFVKSRASNRGLQVVCGYDVVLVTQRPIELLRDLRIIVNNQNPGLHSGSFPAFLMHRVSKACTKRLIDVRMQETKRISGLQESLPVDGWKHGATGLSPIVDSFNHKDTKTQSYKSILGVFVSLW